MSELQIADDGVGRLTLGEGPTLSHLDYRRESGRYIVDAVVVAPQLRGQGIAGDLVAHAVATANDEGLAVQAYCSYAQAWLARHPGAALRTHPA